MAFIVISIFSYIRGYYNYFINENGLLSNILNLVFFYIVGSTTLGQNHVNIFTKEKLFTHLYWGIAFYVILNFFLLYVLNIQSPFVIINRLEEKQLGEGLISRLFGLEFRRTIFPLSAPFGITHLASIAGIVVVESSVKIMCYIKSNNVSLLNKVLKFISAAVCLTMVLILDGRAAFFSIILVLIFVFIFKIINLKKIINYTQLMFIYNSFFPFLFNMLSNFIQPFFQEYGLNRGSAASSFSDREIIWNAVLDFFSNFDPEHIIGYGMWGQYPSNLYMEYETLLFGTYFNQEVSFFTLHSTIFQQLINVGYLGIFVYLSLTFFSIKSLVSLAKSNDEQLGLDSSFAVSNLAVMLYLIFVGNFDPVVAQERFFTTSIYLLLVISSLRTLKLKTLDLSFVNTKSTHPLTKRLGKGFCDFNIRAKNLKQLL
ncbi:MAG: hypothetical protein VKL59_10800 [Nostocaceae cyanobacterium]|nr:hypothetical protein [Nostocaceae cyanobacterium]